MDKKIQSHRRGFKMIKQLLKELKASRIRKKMLKKFPNGNYTKEEFELAFGMPIEEIIKKKYIQLNVKY